MLGDLFSASILIYLHLYNPSLEQVANLVYFGGHCMILRKFYDVLVALNQKPKPFWILLKF